MQSKAEPKISKQWMCLPYGIFNQKFWLIFFTTFLNIQNLKKINRCHYKNYLKILVYSLLQHSINCQVFAEATKEQFMVTHFFVHKLINEIVDWLLSYLKPLLDANLQIVNFKVYEVSKNWNAIQTLLNVLTCIHRMITVRPFR